MPLAGLRIVVTRPDDASGLAARLLHGGAWVEHVPLTRLAALDPAPLDAALAALRAGGWVAFTSANAVKVVAARVAATAGPAPGWATVSPLALRLEEAGVQVAAVGEATARELEGLGVRVALVPAQADADGLVAAFAALPIAPGTAVCFPSAEGAREALPAGLAALGCDVTTVPCYRSVPDAAAEEALAALAGRHAADLVTVTAPSLVRGVAAAHARAAANGQRLPVASIGPVTTQAARAAGLEVACEAATHSSEGLVAAIATWGAVVARA